MSACVYLTLGYLAVIAFAMQRQRLLITAVCSSPEVKRYISPEPVISELHYITLNLE